jgi:hypothetical protein
MTNDFLPEGRNPRSKVSVKPGLAHGCPLSRLRASVATSAGTRHPSESLPVASIVGTYSQEPRVEPLPQSRPAPRVNIAPRMSSEPGTSTCTTSRRSSWPAGRWRRCSTRGRSPPPRIAQVPYISCDRINRLGGGSFRIADESSAATGTVVGPRGSTSWRVYDSFARQPPTLVDGRGRVEAAVRAVGRQDPGLRRHRITPGA